VAVVGLIETATSIPSLYKPLATTIYGEKRSVPFLKNQSLWNIR